MKMTTSSPVLTRSRSPLGALLGLALVASAISAVAQSFDVGSTGALGDVVLSENTTIDLPPDGKLHYRSLTVNSGVRVAFKRNVRNTPVHILSQGDVLVNGTLDVGGGAGSNTDGGAPGPGGFGGGKPGFGTTPPGFGYGPGAGRGGLDSCCDPNNHAGSAAFGTGGFGTASTYGNSFLIPLIGGSGGGGSTGSPGRGGGGGGGAILIASNTRISIAGTVSARGGNGMNGLNHGSGGAIRLVALRVEGNGLLDTRNNRNESLGRIRVDTLERDGIALNFQGVTSVGGNLFALPTVVPRLDTIEVAGTSVPEGSVPQTVLLPFGSSPDRTVKIQARDFGKKVPIRITLTPDTGQPVVVNAEVDNTVNNPAVAEVSVTFPVNSKVTVHCWTR